MISKEHSTTRKLCTAPAKFFAWAGWILTTISICLVLYSAMSIIGADFHSAFAAFVLASMILVLASNCGFTASIVTLRLFRGASARRYLWLNIPV